MSYVDDMIKFRRNHLAESIDIELTPELVEEFSEAMFECVSNALYNVIDETYIIVSEGANIEMTKAFKNRMKEVITHLDNCGNITNKGDLVGGKEELKKALSAVNALEADIKSIDFTTGSAIFGLFVSSFISRIQMAIPSIITKIAAKGYTNAVNNNIGDYLNASFGIMDDAFADMNFDSEPNFGEIMGRIMKASKNAAAGAGNPEIKKAYNKLRIANIFSTAINFVKNIRGMYSVYKRYKAGDTSKEALNLYRNKMLMVCGDLKKLFEAMIKSYDKDIEASKEKK